MHRGSVSIAIALTLLAGCGKQGETNAPEAPSAVQRQAAAGDVGAMLQLAQQAMAATPTNREEATRWYAKAADLGSAEAMYRYAMALRDGAGVRKNFDLGNSLMQKAADKGSLEAKVVRLNDKLFEALIDWEPVGDAPPDDGLQSAVHDLTELSSKVPSAAEELSRVYWNGLQSGGGKKRVTVIARDRSRAVATLAPLAGAGNTDAQILLAAWALEALDAVPGGPDILLERLAGQPDGDVLYRVGELFNWTEQYYKNNPRHMKGRALSWAEANQAAVTWFERASDRGNSSAMRALGRMYSEGRPFKDEGKALEWFKRAAEAGDIDAQEAVTKAYWNGVGGVKDQLKAFEWAMKGATHPTAAGREMARSQRWVAGIYALSEGPIAKDLVLAYAWANVASAQESEDQRQAVELRGNLEQQMTAADIREAQKLSSQYKLGDRITRAASADSKGDSAAGGSVAMQGSAFFVSSSGDLVTNGHVVDGCKTIRIPAMNATADVIVVDQANDLAVVRTHARSRKVPALQDGAGVKQGQDVVVFGFPLDGYLPASGNVTPGLVSALSGPSNNSSLIQISAPVQQGNSGGPVLDRKGNVVGVVVGKANAVRLAKVTGDIPQNVNFAISIATLRSFLQSNRVSFETPSMFTMTKDASELADAAREYTVKLECVR